MPNSGPNGEWLATTPEYWSRVRYPIVAFKLWYADGSTFSGVPADWAGAPVDGVQALVVYHPVDAPTARVLVVAKDEYTLPGQPGSKLGLMIEESEFDRIRTLAIRDGWRP